MARGRQNQLGAAAALLVLACATGGCGGGRAGAFGPPVPVASAAPASAARVTVQFRIAVPPRVASTARRPRFVSPSTASASFAVSPSGGASPVVVNCTSVCSGQISAPVGSDTFTANLYQGSNGTGNVLSTGTATQQIVPDTANVVTLTFDGVPASLAVSLNPSAVTPGTPATVGVTVNALDAGGNTIVGPGSYATAAGAPLTITLADSDTSGATKLSTTAVTAPASAITLSYTGATIPNPTITASATGLTPAPAVLSVGGCGGSSASATDLYAQLTPNQIEAIAPAGSGIPVARGCTVTVAGAAGVAVDAHADLFVADGTGHVDVFTAPAGASAQPSRVITLPWTVSEPQPGAATALGVDGQGNVYSFGEIQGLGTDTVDVYAPGAGAPTAGSPTTPLRTLTGLQGIQYEDGVDASGQIYASNLVGIDVYAASANGHATPARTISQPVAGLLQPIEAATDAAGDTYVLDRFDYRAGRSGAYAVAFYPAGSTAPTHVVVFDSQKNVGSLQGSGLVPYSIATDPSGNLYVASGTLTTSDTYDFALAKYALGSDGDATPVFVVTDTGSHVTTPAWIAADAAGDVYVVDQNFDHFSASYGNSGVDVFDPTGAYLRSFTTAVFSQNTEPADTIAVDPAGTVYLTSSEFEDHVPAAKRRSPRGVRKPAFSNATIAEVAVYAPGSSGGVQPTSTLNVAATVAGGITNVSDVAVSPNGELAVAAVEPSGAQIVQTYAPLASGSQAPQSTFTQAAAPFMPIVAVGLDATGNVYVTQPTANATMVYAGSASGAATQQRTLSSVTASTRGTLDLGCPEPIFVSGPCPQAGAGTYVDASGTVYVESPLTNSVLVFPAGATVPSRSIIGDQTGIAGTFVAIAADPTGRIMLSLAPAAGFVPSPPTFIEIFAAGANGNVAPVRTIPDALNQATLYGTLQIPSGIAVGPGP